MYHNGLPNTWSRLVSSIELLLVQVATTSRGSSGRALQRGGAHVQNGRTLSGNVPPHALQSLNSRAEGDRPRIEGATEVLTLREGETLPKGYTYVTRTRGNEGVAPVRKAVISTNTVDLTTPPEGGHHAVGGDVGTTKRRATAKMNVTRNTNKEVNAAFAKEMKDSFAGGRPPAMNVSEGQTHLKARWHSAAKEVAYNILDLSKDEWKAYSMFDRGKVHKEMNEKYKFDPPLDPKRVDKYLAGCLRNSRAAWKAL